MGDPLSSDYIWKINQEARGDPADLFRLQSERSCRLSWIALLNYKQVDEKGLT